MHKFDNSSEQNPKSFKYDDFLEEDEDTEEKLDEEIEEE